MYRNRACVVIDGCTYTGDVRAEFEAGEARGKIVRGEDIAKTTARRATEEERWRYGVELRILGSRWRPQTRAPHYPTPEPYVYRKRTQSLAWSHDDAWRRRVVVEYEAWLAARDKPPAKPAPKLKAPDPWAKAKGWRDAPRSEGKTMDSVETPTVVRLHVATPTPAREDMAERKAAAAQLLRDIAGEYGPRRAHKLRAMADWLTAPAAQIKREG